MEEKTGGVDSAGAEDDFPPSGQDFLEAHLCPDLDSTDTRRLACRRVVVGEMMCPRLEEEVQVVSAVRAVRHDGVEVSDRSRGAVTVVRVVRNVEKSDRVVKTAAVDNVRVEVLEHRGTRSHAGGVDPVARDSVTLLGRDGDNVQLQTVAIRLQRVGAPGRAAVVLSPVIEIGAKGSERDERVVRTATAEDACARVTDVRVAHGLGRRGIVIVQVGSEQFQPAFQIKDSRRQKWIKVRQASVIRSTAV